MNVTHKDMCNARRVAATSLRMSVRGDEWLDVAVAKAIRSAFYGFKAGAFGEVLAELIDLPTCSMDKTESLKTEGGETVNVWECSTCGQECEEINGSYEFCPHCGAEVVDDDD